MRSQFSKSSTDQSSCGSSDTNRSAVRIRTCDSCAFGPAPRDGAAAAAAGDPDLEAFLHLYALNRGVLLTPFHNMALFSPHHTAADVDRHTAVFGEAIAALLEA